MKYGHYCSIKDIYHMPTIKIPSFKNESFICLLCAKEHAKESQYFGRATHTQSLIRCKTLSITRHTGVIPGSFQLNKPMQPQTNHNQRTSMLTMHCISQINMYIQLTVYRNDHITITQPTHNSTEELLHPLTSRCHSLSVSIKIVARSPSTMDENTCTLQSMVPYHYPPTPTFMTRQEVEVGLSCYKLTQLFVTIYLYHI